MRPIVARDLMTPDVLSVSEDMRLSELAAFLVDHQVSGVAVRDEAGNYVGVVSATDVIAATADGDKHLDWGHGRPGFYMRGWEDRLSYEELSKMRIDEDTLRVRAVMTPKLFRVTTDAEAPEIDGTMLRGHLHRLLVIDDVRIVGIISTSDLLGLLVEGRQDSPRGGRGPEAASAGRE